MSRILPLLFALPGAIPAAESDSLVRIGNDRFRQPGPIKAIASSPDGKRLATATDGSVRVWDAADGRQVHVVPLTAFVAALGFADGGRTLVATADDQDAQATDLVRIDLATGKMQSRVRALDTRSSAAQFSPDGAWLLLLPAEIARGYVCVDTAAGKAVWAQPVHDGRGHASHAFRPDGKALAVGETKGWIVLRDLATGKVLHEHRVPAGYVEDMTFAPDGSDLVARVRLDGPGRIVRMDADTGAERWSRPTTDWARRLTFAADGTAVRYLRTGPPESDDFQWAWLDARTGKSLDRTLVTDGSNAVVTRADRKVLAVGGYGGFISQWDLETGRRIEVASAEPPEEVTALRYSTDGRKLRGWARGWYEWDLKAGIQTRLSPNVDRWMSRHLTVSDDQKWLARVVGQQNGEPGTLELVDLATGRTTPAALPKALYHSFHFAPDGRLLVVDGTTVAVVDPATGKPTVEFPWNHQHRPVLFTADGKTAVTVAPAIDHLHGTRWDLTTGKATTAWQAVFQNPFHSDIAIAWHGHLSADGRVLGLTFFLGVLGDPEGHALLLDARTGRLLAQWKDQEVYTHWTFSPDGRAFVIFPSRQGVEVRETATGGRRLTGFGKDHPFRWTLRAAAFSPDGVTVALAHSPGPVGLWDLIGKPTTKWTDEPPDRVWATLADPDAERAFAAIRHLRHHPAEAVAFLKEHVKVPTVPRVDWVAERIQALDAAQFRDREKATADLAGVGELVVGELRAALKTASPEARTRLDVLVEKAAGMTPDKLQAIRACEVLEGIGSAEAREVLAAWARGPAGATLTREAGESLGRLTGRR